MSTSSPVSASQSGRQKALQEELRELVDVVGPTPLVDLLLERAFQIRATDLHFDPIRTGLRIRIRVDGLLHTILELPSNLQSQVISRIKLLAGMDITERRFSQDGHITNTSSQSSRDIRVGSGPTIYGERLVLRLMPDSSSYNTLDEIGLEPSQKDLVNKALRHPYGMILSVGPVGSGKSTTVYNCLNLLNKPDSSLVTIEDPVERRIDGISQIQIDTKIDFHFADALRGILRQDPDVIMVGEIRDAETARIAARAGLTGIKVLSTLHASDPAATIDVFRDFGVPPMFIADSVNCIISQRLLRTVCSQHRELYVPDAAECRFLGIPIEEAPQTKLVRGVPAPSNFHTGYLGRTGIFEVMLIDAELRNLILDGRPSSEIRSFAVSHGLQTLEQSAINKVRAGITTIAEVHQTLMIE